MTHPDRSAILQQVTTDIKKAGWSMIGVFPEGRDDPVPTFFCYTIGFWKRFQQPEMAMFGVHPNAANGVLWNVYRALQRGEVFTDGQVVTERLIQDDYPVAFRSMPNSLDHCALRVAHAYYQTWDFPVLQMVLSDPNRLFPWEDGCTEDMRTMQQIPLRLSTGEA